MSRVRGLGNPFRGPPDPSIYASQLGVKFKAWRTAFSLENGLGTVAQLPSVKAGMFDQWIGAELKVADPERRAALATLKLTRDAASEEGRIDADFYRSFLTWLMGKGKDEDHSKTPWYRRPVALELEEVRELLEAFLWEVSAVENALLKLVLRGPQSLNDYFLYYKYILQHDKFVLENDPWFFLEFKLYSQGKAWKLGEDDRPEYLQVLEEYTRLNSNLLVNSQELFGKLQEFFESLRDTGQDAMQKAADLHLETARARLKYYEDQQGPNLGALSESDDDLVQAQLTLSQQMVDLQKQIIQLLEQRQTPPATQTPAQTPAQTPTQTSTQTPTPVTVPKTTAAPASGGTGASGGAAASDESDFATPGTSRPGSPVPTPALPDPTPPPETPPGTIVDDKGKLHSTTTGQFVSPQSS